MNLAIALGKKANLSFARMLSYKAENAGKRVIRVDPRSISRRINMESWIETITPL